MKKVKDHYYNKAKNLKYPARSVFKLEEIDKKYSVLKNGQKVLDLGAAPGSWLKYISQKIGKNGKAIGIDLSNLNMTIQENTIFIKSDFNDVDYESDDFPNKFDVIVSDMAPKTTGRKDVDHYRFELSQRSLRRFESPW